VRIHRIGLVAGLLLAAQLAGTGCILIPKIEKRNVRLVVSQYATVPIHAVGAINTGTFAGALAGNLGDVVSIRQALDNAGIDAIMVRYNAAHTGAEHDIFPALSNGKPSILAYTATSWRKLLKRPKGWQGSVMTAGDCYRFQLSSPHVDMALMGPSSRAQMEENLAALEKGPLSPDEEKWMREFGKAVHG